MSSLTTTLVHGMSRQRVRVALILFGRVPLYWVLVINDIFAIDSVDDVLSEASLGKMIRDKAPISSAQPVTGSFSLSHD